MNRRENLVQLVRGDGAHWLPFTLDVGSAPGFTKPALETFKARTGEEHPEEFFDYDFRTVSLSTRFGGDDPASLHGRLNEGTVFDEWGIGHWAGGAEGTYEQAFPPLARSETIEDIEALPVPVIVPGNAPSVIDAYHRRGYPVFGYAGSVYEWAWWLRGMERFMIDLLAEPWMAEAVLEKVAGYTTSLARATAKAGVDVLCFYDDAGMQSGLQVAPEIWREFIKPSWREVIEAVRSGYPDRVFFLHSCGKIDEIVPDIVELGFDILHPIQPECMDYQKVRREFGRDIVLCATISAQHLFPFGSQQEIRQWVEDTRRLCASDKRAILCPSNLIQPETPWENIVAFADAAQDCRNRG